MSTQKSVPSAQFLSASPQLLSNEGSPSPSPTPSSQASSGRGARANREYDCIEPAADSPFVVAVTADKNAKKRRKMEASLEHCCAHRVMMWMTRMAMLIFMILIMFKAKVFLPFLMAMQAQQPVNGASPTIIRQEDAFS